VYDIFSHLNFDRNDANTNHFLKLELERVRQVFIRVENTRESTGKVNYGQIFSDLILKYITIYLLEMGRDRI